MPHNSPYWRIWPDTSFSPAINMAIDDLLVNQIAEHSPILRFYGWNEPCYTLGYFQPFAAAPHDGTIIIRRPSGGGVVNHKNDFTFSLAFSDKSSLYQVDRFESYRQINQAVADAFLSLGIDCTLQQSEIAKEVDKSFLVCFESPAKFDVVSAAGKLCGGAQRRHRHGMLHQGSILLDKLPQLGRSILADALQQAFTHTFGVKFIRFKPTPDFLNEAHELATSRYENVSWNQKK